MDKGTFLWHLRMDNAINNARSVGKDRESVAFGSVELKGGQARGIQYIESQGGRKLWVVRPEHVVGSTGSNLERVSKLIFSS